MWRKLPLRDRGRDSQIRVGAPVLLESTYDQGQLERASNVADLQHPAYDPSIRPSNARREPDNSRAHLAPLDFRRVPSKADPHGYRPSMAASSVYSQPSPAPETRHDWPRNKPHAPSQQYHGDVSPPSSPDRPNAYDNGDVSPIEEQSPGMTTHEWPSARQGSHIPIPRKATPSDATQTRNRQVTPSKPWTQDVGKKPMAWDEYSGEPTFDGIGKPGQVKPGSSFSVRSELRPVQRKAYQPPAEADESQRMGFRDKASRFAQKGLTIDTRPPWKGASGRQAIVERPKDNPGQPIPVPRRSSKRVKSPSPEYTPQSGAPLTAVRTMAPTPETARVAEPNYTQETQNEDIKPTVPLKAGRNSPRQIVASPASPQFKPTGYPSPVSPTDRIVTPTQSMQEQRYPSLAQNSGDIVIPKRVSSMNPDKDSHSRQSSGNQEPGSRFSWTTTATSTTYQHSPPPSPPPPIPAAYANISTPAPVDSGSGSGSGTSTARVSPDPASALLNRGHPTRRLGDQAAMPPPSPPFSARSVSSTTRKPVPAIAPAVQEPIRQTIPLGDWRSGVTARVPRRAASLAPSTTSTVDKLLPKTPQELNSQDLITSLEAQRDDLFNQRSNIQRVIRDLEKPEERNPLVSDFRATREREKRIAALKEDLMEVANQQHDVGLRLHMAWKRREREDPNTPGSIFWVKRIANGD